MYMCPGEVQCNYMWVVLDIGAMLNTLCVYAYVYNTSVYVLVQW